MTESFSMSFCQRKHLKKPRNRIIDELFTLFRLVFYTYTNFQLEVVILLYLRKLKT